MEAKRCFEVSCLLEAEYTCQCSSPETYLCKVHWMKHCELTDRDHAFESIFLKPYEGTKEGILKFIEKEKSKKEKNKNKIISSFSQNLCNSENCIEELLKKLDSDSIELGNLFDKISKTQKISKFDQDPIIKLLTMQPDDAIENFKKIIPSNENSYNRAHLLCGLSDDIGKMIESFIKEKFEAFLDKRLLNIEKTLERHSNEIDSNKVIEFNQIKEAMNHISNLMNEAEKTKKEFEDFKILAQVKMQNELNLLNTQLQNLKKWLPDLQLHDLRGKKSEILDLPINPKIEQDFKLTCELFEKELFELRSAHPSLSQAYEDYIKAYHQKASLYLIDEDIIGRKTNLFISNTESERDEVKVLDGWEPLKCGTCILEIFHLLAWQS
ncbi:unnamed protein product [Blepharisma stoltei]|uniref:Uncharacterized protein n=1 Tax=Blepharisma stoltei TaxID=1481888 RepID=A0AAU9K7R5_9CILI|nr:unnamed protein product [Blepharisma stoltei]